MFQFRRKLSEEKRQGRVKNRRVHMANERTFLSWSRISIGIMAFGFVIEKFIVPCHPSVIADMLVAILLGSIGILLAI